MFQLVEGNYTANLEGIREGYRKEFRDTEWWFQINVSAEHIGSLFFDLCKRVRQPSFLVFELPTNSNEEEKIRKSNEEPLHKDIFYIDGLDFSRFDGIFKKYQELLINDGQISFGLGSHEGIDEVYVGAYKVFEIYTDEPEKYDAVLLKHGFPHLEQLRTVIDNFTPDTPGLRQSLVKNGINVYELVEELKEYGLYFAERRDG